MADIFISYAHEDIAEASRLAEQFRSNHWKVWMDTGIVVGDDWRATIERELENARAVVVLWSKSSARSRFVKSEVARAENKLFPCFNGEIWTLPLGWDQIQTVDLTPWFKSGEAESMVSLINSLEEHLGKTEPDPDDPYDNRETIKNLLKELYATDIDVARRQEIGATLARFRDPRPGLGINYSGLPDIHWIKIPHGNFIYGQKNDDELIGLDDFYISKYLVTNQQYQQFVEAGGYDNSSLWEGLKPARYREPQWKDINIPRAALSWYEAIAFCRWLSKVYGHEIRLPTEKEWEKACRGTQGNIYPWGNEYRIGLANCDNERLSENHLTLKQPSAVGVFPNGCSTYGVMDIAGNAWEWCMNKYQFPEDDEIDESGDCRTIRGGCWFRSPVQAAGNYRFAEYPDNRDTFFTGIRLVTKAREMNELHRHTGINQSSYFDF